MKVAAVLSLALGPNRYAERVALWSTFESLLDHVEIHVRLRSAGDSHE